MNKTRKLHSVLAVLALSAAVAAAGCNVSFSTANIKSAKLAANREGTQETTVFAKDQVIYCIVRLANAPDDTKVKSVWTAVSVEGTAPNFKIDEAEKTSGDGVIIFDLSNTQPWPTGQYKLELFLNDKLDRALEFQVQ
ncbi:MAG: hypothetical protein A2Y56_02030 [Candidatus Aminicenantes bacterium RBG_13_63_10]|nr:MAG: hypothetical protein A2Y56_02030 [Candidatus Aminicenantes bacterium RBG_13_63_10]